jgi:hypothetical protein
LRRSRRQAAGPPGRRGPSNEIVRFAFKRKQPVATGGGGTKNLGCAAGAVYALCVRRERARGIDEQRRERGFDAVPDEPADARRSAEPDSRGPGGPACPAASGGEGLQARHLRQRAVADSEDEGPDPAVDLGVAVGLEPGLGESGGGVAAADSDEVPDSQERARAEQEEQAGGR